MTIDIIIMAMVAIFIVLRLRSELGRSDHSDDIQSGEQNPYRPSVDPRSQERHQGTAPVRALDHQLTDASHEPMPQAPSYSPAIEAGISDITRKDRSFSLEQFMAGASAAYPMILKAFWKGDTATLKQFLSDEVYASFEGAITARSDQEIIVANQFLDLSNCVATSVTLSNSIAEITVQFTAEIIAVSKDSAGRIIEGDPSDSVTVNDLWTFSRDVTSSDPNWTLTGTQSA